MKVAMKSSELIFCNRCREHRELHYTNDEVVTETPCKCINNELIRPDWMEVIKPIIDEFKKRSENVTRNSKSISQISPTIKTNK